MVNKFCLGLKATSAVGCRLFSQVKMQEGERILSTRGGRPRTMRTWQVEGTSLCSTKVRLRCTLSQHLDQVRTQAWFRESVSIPVAHSIEMSLSLSSRLALSRLTSARSSCERRAAKTHSSSWKVSSLTPMCQSWDASTQWTDLVPTSLKTTLLREAWCFLSNSRKSQSTSKTLCSKNKNFTRSLR